MQDALELCCVEGPVHVSVLLMHVPDVIVLMGRIHPGGDVLNVDAGTYNSGV